MNEYFAEKIYECRKKAGMSQKTLGAYLGISDRAVSNWETGVAYPSTENLLKLSHIFHVPVEYLCKEHSEEPQERKSGGMESLRELYRIGRGPSSSHTIAPELACRHISEQYPDADAFYVVLHGSLAKTGKGHGADEVIRKTLGTEKAKIEFDFSDSVLPHPNTMDVAVYRDGKVIANKRVFSVGGGKYRIEGEQQEDGVCVYSLSTFQDIAAYCRENGLRLWQFVEENEGTAIREYMMEIWKQMKASILRGLQDEGILPGGLGVQKKAKQLLAKEHMDETPETRENRLVSAYAFAVGEQNAAGETIVTAPTCGAAGVLPAVLYYQQQKRRCTDEQIVDALETAGVIGNLIKTNGSISGAECGCQAEIGSACAMAAAALGELFQLNLDKIEYAAEISIEHHLGLTCDPICGLVQIPCIERNAVAAMRAINAVSIANFLCDTRKISFDNVVAVMKKTGQDLSNRYKETSEAGLATILL